MELLRYQAFLYSVILSLFLSWFCSTASSSRLSGMGNGRDLKSCLDISSQCRKNSSCNSVFRKVKRTCKSKRNMCHNYKSLVKCADHIDFLKAFGFGEKCHCSGPSFNQLKRIYACSKVHNLLFANPCYDHGVKEREEKRSLSMATIKPERISNSSDVIVHSSTRFPDARPLPTKTSNRTSTFHPKVKNASNHSAKMKTNKYLSATNLTRLSTKNTKEAISFDNNSARFKTFVQNNEESEYLNNKNTPGIQDEIKVNYKNETKNKASFENEGIVEKKSFLEKETDHSEIGDHRDEDVSSSINQLTTLPTNNNVYRLKKHKNNDAGDANTYEVAKLATKYMKYNQKASDGVGNSTKNSGKISKEVEKKIAFIERERSSSEQEIYENHAILLSAIITAITCVVLILLFSCAGWCYQRLKQTRREAKKKPIHSAIIVSSFYDERDLKLNRKANFV